MWNNPYGHNQSYLNVDQNYMPPNNGQPQWTPTPGPSNDWKSPNYQMGPALQRRDHFDRPAGYNAPPNPNIANCQETKQAQTLAGAVAAGGTGFGVGMKYCPPGPLKPHCVGGTTAGGAGFGAYEGYVNAKNSSSCQDVITRGHYDTCNGSNHYCPDRL